MSGYPTAPLTLKVARQVLASSITGLNFGTKVPSIRPAIFGRVSRAGGSRPNLVTDRARILVELWATTVEAVEQLSVDSIAALQNSQGTIVLGSAIRGFDNIEGPTDLPDPDVSDMERWQFLGDFHVSTS